MFKNDFWHVKCILQYKLKLESSLKHSSLGPKKGLIYWEIDLNPLKCIFRNFSPLFVTDCHFSSLIATFLFSSLFVFQPVFAPMRHEREAK